MDTTIYTIKKGDTLFSIAQRKLGDGHRWTEIKKSDGTKFTEAEARQLQAGQKIFLPQAGVSSSYSTSSNGRRRSANNKQSAMVQGDFCQKISQRSKIRMSLRENQEEFS